MTLHDDRTFMRHFSWVLVALVVITVFFIFIAFLIVGETGVDSHSGYSYVEYMKSHQGQSSSQAASKGNQSGNGKAAPAAADSDPAKAAAKSGETRAAAGDARATNPLEVSTSTRNRRARDWPTPAG